MENRNYEQALNDYLSNLEQYSYAKDIIDRNGLYEVKRGIRNGLNFGSKEIADWQNQLGMQTPKTADEIERAKAGNFNAIPLSANVNEDLQQNAFSKALGDFFAGYKENKENAYDPSNLLSNPNKSGMFKAGEAIGTTSRFLEKPAVKGLIAGGLGTAAFGLPGGAMLGYLVTNSENKKNTGNNLYRQHLQQLGVDTGNTPGKITSDIYTDTASMQNEANKVKSSIYNTDVKMQIASLKNNTERAKALMDMYKNGALTKEGLAREISDFGITEKDLRESNATRDINLKENRLEFDKTKHKDNLGFKYSQLGEQSRHHRTTEGLTARGQDLTRRGQDLNYLGKQQAQQNKFNKVVNGNRALVSKINRAIRLVDQNRNAIGGVMKGYATEANGGMQWVNNNLNKGSTAAEIATRSAIYDLNSQTVHDRAGTAQTAQELKRLAPFLPSAYDDPDTAIRKLKSMRDAVNDETRFYTKNNGNNGGLAF